MTEKEASKGNYRKSLHPLAFTKFCYKTLMEMPLKLHQCKGGSGVHCNWKGSWSFGDPSNPDGGYFKKEALAWSWELLTEVYKIPKDRLYVSVFAGDEKEGLPKDQEAYDIWKQYISEDRILLGNKKDNFWEMGETGPCGPCSEIHVDMRPDEERSKFEGSKLVNQDDPQVIEIWNNVFMQFNRLKNGSLEKLPGRHVDHPIMIRMFSSQ